MNCYNDGQICSVYAGNTEVFGICWEDRCMPGSSLQCQTKGSSCNERAEYLGNSFTILGNCDYFADDTSPKLKCKVDSDDSGTTPMAGVSTDRHCAGRAAGNSCYPPSYSPGICTYFNSGLGNFFISCLVNYLPDSGSGS
ncbi:MAG: hypothetical protein LBQ60_12030 [Bacteroidales bacterium]|jgi:hypothetical protein|nr:hypothetical protein [Bacteroidales bacterium]